jgi:hypothetical protein
VVQRIERAERRDLRQIVELAAIRRKQYATYQPEFWHPAIDAEDRQRDHFAALLDDDGTLVVVARDGSTVHGFAVARLTGAPPVYNPGGLTCAVDDFAVADAAEWPAVGPVLLDAVRSWGATRGAAQLVVVVAHLDEAKRAMLEAADLSLASEWWVAPIPDQDGPEADGQHLLQSGP